LTTKPGDDSKLHAAAPAAVSSRFAEPGVEPLATEKKLAAKLAAADAGRRKPAVAPAAAAVEAQDVGLSAQQRHGAAAHAQPLLLVNSVRTCHAPQPAAAQHAAAHAPAGSRVEAGSASCESGASAGHASAPAVTREGHVGASGAAAFMA
jgi:hypothetical protein